MTLSNDGEEELLDGAVVSCQAKPEKDNYNCVWMFTTDGYIQSIGITWYHLCIKPWLASGIISHKFLTS